MNFVLDLYDENEEKWSRFSYFYMSMEADVEIDFSDKAKTFEIPGH